MLGLDDYDAELELIFVRSQLSVQALQVVAVTTGLEQDFWDSDLDVVRQKLPDLAELLVVNDG